MRLDAEDALGAEDLGRLAIAAWLTNRDDACLPALERCHFAWLDRGNGPAAARAAFWLGFRLAGRGEVGPASGWLARARRVIEGTAGCVEHGYLLLADVEHSLGEGDWDGAFDLALRAAEAGRRCGDADLVACALHLEGRALLGGGDARAGLARLDEAMVAVTADTLSPLMTGLVYCSVIGACQDVHALDRAREWTAALARWCGAQPQIVAFTGTCLVHRAEILQLAGAWEEALAEADRACERYRTGIDPQPPAAAFYRRGELHRLRGDARSAEADYRSASLHGCEPQPGLALLRLAQGRRAVAMAAIRRAALAASGPDRTRLLPALVEIALAAGERGVAEEACRELERLGRAAGSRLPEALAAEARGAVLLAAGDAGGALAPLSGALAGWRAIAAPYEAARVRVLVGQAYQALDDREGAELELLAARAAFAELGAAPDAARVEAVLRRRGGAHGLTRREVEVLRLVAAGRTNGAAAAELGLSERTIERHLGNVFTKLDLPNRAAATAWAYKHGLA
ncbi:MAG: helix-turn-helix transcriptional regulator [Amaricoccus sp.]